MILVFLACSGEKDDSGSPTAVDDSGTSGGSQTNIDADVTLSPGANQIDALEALHVVGGAMAEFAGLPEYYDIVAGDLVVPPPLGPSSCVLVTVASVTDLTLDYSGCKDDRGGSVQFTGFAPVTAQLNDVVVDGYTLSGTIAYDQADYRHSFSMTGLAVSGPDGFAATVSADGHLWGDTKKEMLIHLNADFSVAHDGVTTDFDVGGGKGAIALNPPASLKWDMEEGERLPVGGTVVFTLSEYTTTALVSSKVLMGLGAEKDIVPLQGLPDVPAVIEQDLVVGLNYDVQALVPGISVDADAYDVVMQKSDLMAIAAKCPLRQEYCDSLSTFLDEGLADEVTTILDWAGVSSGLGAGIAEHFNPDLAPK